MKVLLIGGTGRLSADTTALCIRSGFEVYLFNRGSNNSFSDSNVHYINGDINNIDIAKKVLEGLSFDAVIDYLTYNLETLKKRISTFQGRTKQYVFISSATVFKPQGAAITEKSKIGNDQWGYCKNKLVCEKYLRQQKDNLSFAFTIVRPYVTYDKKRIPFPIISKKSCWNLLYRIENGLPILICGDGTQRVTLTSTKDFAVGIVGIMGNAKSYYEDFNIVGDLNYTWNDVINEIENYTGKNAKVVSVPMSSIAKLVPSFAQEILYDKGLSHTFDNQKIKSIVPEFKMTIDLHDGLSETLAYLSNNKDVQLIDYEWNAMENVVSKKCGYSDINVSLRDKWLYFKSESPFLKKIKGILKKIFK